MDKVVIFGIGEMAKVAHYMFNRDTCFDVVAFTVDSKYVTSNEFCGLEIVAFENICSKYPPNQYKLFVAVGPSRMNGLRQTKFIEAKEKGYTMVSYISQSAICDSPVGENCYIGDFTVINPFVEVGDNNIIHEHVNLSNDCKLGNHCYLSPKVVIGTNAKVEDNCIIGIASIVKTGINIAEKTLIGAGCYISKDTAYEGVYGEKSSQFYGNMSTRVDISM